MTSPIKIVFTAILVSFKIDSSHSFSKLKHRSDQSLGIQLKIRLAFDRHDVVLTTDQPGRLCAPAVASGRPHASAARRGSARLPRQHQQWSVLRRYGTSRRWTSALGQRREFQGEFFFVLLLFLYVNFHLIQYGHIFLNVVYKYFSFRFWINVVFSVLLRFIVMEIFEN